MLGISVYIAAEALARVGSPAHVASTPMLLVGGLGLAINVVALLLLRGGAAESLNVKGAYLEVVADSLGSVGVIVAGLMVSATGESWWDTGIALAIALFEWVRAIVLGREGMVVLGQHAPAAMEPTEVVAALGNVNGVDDVHDLHLCTHTSRMHVATAHLVTHESGDPPCRPRRGRDMMLQQLGVEHATLQVEPRTHTGYQELA